MRPTIYDVAERAGVSIATVSRVLNGSPKATAETRDVVLRAVRELGYRPNAAARSLAGRSTETLALVFPEISSPFFAEIIRGAEIEARQHGYHLLIYGIPEVGEADALLPVLSSRVDGLILGGHCDDAFVQSLDRQGVPFVLLGRGVEGYAVSAIQADSYHGVYEAIIHLIDHGYRRIAFIGGPEGFQQSLVRLQAYRQALSDCGWPAEPGWVIHSDFSEAGGHTTTAELLALPQPPRAIFAANDQMAIGAIDAVRAAGLQVPEDVAVVGFDDIPVAAYVYPALTTVRRQIYESGVLAVQLLLQRIDDPEKAPEHLTLPTRLVVRRSCGCG
jgi:DNA-binding LacI/PurR family transcriptional regulator